MIIKTVEDVRGTKGDMDTQHWASLRFLHKEDGMGFTMTDTTLRAGMDEILWYKNHLEACYCLEGEGTVENLETGEIHEIKPGTIYALDKNDRHRLVIKSDMRLVCTFNPALSGGEVHDEDGAYAASD